MNQINWIAVSLAVGNGADSVMCEARWLWLNVRRETAYSILSLASISGWDKCYIVDLKVWPAEKCRHESSLRNNSPIKIELMTRLPFWSNLLNHTALQTGIGNRYWVKFYRNNSCLLFSRVEIIRPTYSKIVIYFLKLSLKQFRKYWAMMDHRILIAKNRTLREKGTFVWTKKKVTALGPTAVWVTISPRRYKYCTFASVSWYVQQSHLAQVQASIVSKRYSRCTQFHQVHQRYQTPLSRTGRTVNTHFSPRLHSLILVSWGALAVFEKEQSVTILLWFQYPHIHSNCMQVHSKDMPKNLVNHGVRNSIVWTK